MNTAYIYAEQIEPVFVRLTDYNLAMLNKADIDGGGTTGGTWYQDTILSDLFPNYKQVIRVLGGQMAIEYGNVELDVHRFVVTSVNGLKIKVGGTEGTIWNTLNLTNVSQLNNDAGYLQSNDLDGFIYDVTYNSTTHTITFYQQNEPNIVIDLPIEQLIKGVQLVGNDLVFTFEDGSTVTVPLNTLLVGVVKSVNGLTPNSQGEIVLNITDIPNLSSELANKLDIRMAGLVSNLTQPEKDAILSKLGVVNNIVQVLGLSGNAITLSNGGGSISLNIANIGGLQNALDNKANVNGNNLTNIFDWRTNLGIGLWDEYDGTNLATQGLYGMLYDNSVNKWRPSANDVYRNWLDVYSTTQVDGFLAGKANTSGHYSGLSVGNSDKWNGQSYNQGAISSNTIDVFMTNNGNGWGYTSIPQVQSALGITTALNLNLQQVTDNGNTHRKALVKGWNFAEGNTPNILRDLEGYTSGIKRAIFATKGTTEEWGLHALAFSGNVVAYTFSLADGTDTGINFYRDGGLQVGGTISTASHGTSADWYQGFLNSQTAINLTWQDVLSKGATATSKPIFNVAGGLQFDLKSTSASGNNYFSFKNNSNVETHNVGLSSSNNNHFYFYTADDNFWQFYSNGVEIQRIGSGNVQFFKDLIVHSSNIHTTNYGSASDWNAKVSQSQLGNYALLSQVPTNNNQLTNGANYTTLPLVQSWVSTQGFSTQIPNNGTFTVQGTGALTGNGSTSADASANASATLDLTTATKNDIALGKDANTQMQSLFSSVARYYKLFDMTGGGAVDPSEQVITQIFTRNGNQTINISDHFLEGADLKIYGSAGGITTVNINAVDLVGSTLTTINLEGNGRSFHWSADLNAWVEYFN